jgi:hypothetical protein
VWEDEQDTSGCPEFNGSGLVQPVEIETAVLYLNDLKPKTLMVYSRGASILGHALRSKKLVHIPTHVIFVSAAWKRWGSVPVTAFDKIHKKTIYHGELDIKVPLAHSFELAQGSSVGILFKGDHYAGKDYTSGGLQTIRKEIENKYPKLFDSRGRCLGTLSEISWKRKKANIFISNSGDGLPDWGLKGYGNSKQIIQQIEWVRRVSGKSLK